MTIRDYCHAHPSSKSIIVLPLLPIFLIGVFPMLLISLLGPAGLVILGILVASAGLTDILDANSTFSEQIIVHGYAKGSERTGQRTALRSEIRFACDDCFRCRPCGRRLGGLACRKRRVSL